MSLVGTVDHLRYIGVILVSLIKDSKNLERVLDENLWVSRNILSGSFRDYQRTTVW
jgi:hypothetical protein